MNITHVHGNTYVLEGHGLMGLYRVDDTRCILIDSGVITEREELMDTLAQAQLTPVGVMSTHVHLDHSINNAALRAKYHCPVAVPAGEVETCRTLMGLKAYFYTYSPHMIRDYQGEMLCPVDAPIPYEDGTFVFCGVPFHILHTPGHSLDHICITTPDGVCFVGDAVFSNEGLNLKLPYGLDLTQMMDSAQRLRHTHHAAYVTAHRGVHTQVEPLIDATCALIGGRAEEVAALVDTPMTVSQLWQKVNAHHTLRSRRVQQVPLMERNLRGLVEVLVDSGRLRYVAEDGMLYLAPKEDV